MFKVVWVFDRKKMFNGIRKSDCGALKSALLDILVNEAIDKNFWTLRCNGKKVEFSAGSDIGDCYDCMIHKNWCKRKLVYEKSNNL